MASRDRIDWTVVGTAGDEAAADMIGKSYIGRRIRVLQCLEKTRSLWGSSGDRVGPGAYDGAVAVWAGFRRRLDFAP